MRSAGRASAVSISSGPILCPVWAESSTDTHGTVLQLSKENFGLGAVVHEVRGRLNKHLNTGLYYPRVGYDIKYKGQSGLDLSG